MPELKEEPAEQHEALPNRFASLDLHEPSEAFLAAPDIERPPKREADPIDYAAETPASFEDAMVALFMLIDDMNKARASIRWVWRNFKDSGLDLVPAAIATNTTIELVRSLLDDVLPLLDAHGGLKHCLEKCYFAKCLMKGFEVEELLNSSNPENFNYDTYEVATESFFMPFLLTKAFQDVIEPSQVPLYRGIFGKFDANSDHTKKSGFAKFKDDRALTMPFFSDLITVVLEVRDWPVRDEFVRGMADMERTGKIPFYFVFAIQVFLDVTYTLGPYTARGWGVFSTHTNFIVKELNTHLEFHKNLRSDTWPASNDHEMTRFRSRILWLLQDPIFKVQSRYFAQQGSMADRNNINRIFHMSPTTCGLILYQFRFCYRDAGITLAGAFGSIQYAEHLYSALQTSGLLSGLWVDMSIVKTMLGAESFYAGGQEPRTLADQFKKYCLQMGVSPAAIARNSRKGAKIALKAGPRGIKVNAPVSSMFEERYAHERDIVLTSETVNRIIKLSLYEMETDEETGELVMGQIMDEKKLDEKKKLRHALETRSKQSNAQSIVSLPKLVELLTNSLQAEALEFSFPYMAMHRQCWQFFRAVKKSCDLQLRTLFGPTYLETESQLSSLVGYILMLACGVENHALYLGPLQSAAQALNEMLASGGGGLILKQTGRQLGMGIEVVQEREDGEEHVLVG